jgi:hypothetical protein
MASSEEMTSLMTPAADVSLSSTVSIVDQWSSSSTVGDTTTNWDNATTSDLLTFSPDYGGGGGESDGGYSFCR